HARAGVNTRADRVSFRCSTPLPRPMKLSYSTGTTTRTRSMSFDLVLFGGTGDLAWRKLMPALFQAFRHGTLPADGRIIGIARDDLDDAKYRALIRSRFDDVELAKRPTPEEFDRFAALLHFLRVDLSKPADYQRLAA